MSLFADAFGLMMRLSDLNPASSHALLAAAGRCVLRVPAPVDFHDLLATISLLGQATGAVSHARTLGTRIRERLRVLRSLPPLHPQPRAVVIHGGFTFGRGALQHDCLRRAGLTNVIEQFGLVGTPPLATELLATAAGKQLLPVAWGHRASPRPYH